MVVPGGHAHNGIARGLHLGSEREEGAHRREIDRRRFLGSTGTDHTAHRLRKEERGARRAEVAQGRRARDVDPFADHAHADDEPSPTQCERRQPLGGVGILRQHHRGLLAGDAGGDRGVGARGLLVVGEDDSRGVLDARGTLGSHALVDRRDDMGHPSPGRRERCAPRLVLVLLRAAAERGGIGIARVIHPSGDTRVRREDDGTHHAISQGIAVGVGEIGKRPHLVAVLLIGDEGDPLIRLGAERRAAQPEAPLGGVEGLAHAIAPGEAVTGVMDLIHDHEARACLRTIAVQHRLGGHLGIRRDVALRALAYGAHGVG